MSEWSKIAYQTLKIGGILMPNELRRYWYDLLPTLASYPGNPYEDAGRIDEQGYLQLRCDYEARSGELEAENARLNQANDRLKVELADVLAVAIDRGDTLAYVDADEGYRVRLAELDAQDESEVGDE